MQLSVTVYGGRMRIQVRIYVCIIIVHFNIQSLCCWTGFCQNTLKVANNKQNITDVIWFVTCYRLVKRLVLQYPVRKRIKTHHSLHPGNSTSPRHVWISSRNCDKAVERLFVHTHIYQCIYIQLMKHIQPAQTGRTSP